MAVIYFLSLKCLRWLRKQKRLIGGFVDYRFRRYRGQNELSPWSAGGFNYFPTSVASPAKIVQSSLSFATASILTCRVLELAP